MTSASAIARGKIIISGEHSVVYGHPAFAIPLPIQLTLTLFLDQPKNTPTQNSPYFQYIQTKCEEFFQKKFSSLCVHIDSAIPQNSGLGSSAAVACAYIKAYAKLCKKHLSPDELFSLVLGCEKWAHKTPSGIDPAVVVYETPLVLSRKNNSPFLQKKSQSFFSLHNCVIIHSGTAQESTKDMIERVARHPQKMAIVKKIGTITKKIVTDLELQKNPWPLLHKNQLLLERLGIVGRKAAKMVRHIEAAQGYAKVCGAGGIKGGSGVILAYHEKREVLLAMIQKYQWQQIM